MKEKKANTDRQAFTLVELLVVMSIIAILIAVLLPAMGKVRTTAKVTQITAQINALDQGILQFRGSVEIGGAYPPSSSDEPARQMIANPLETAAVETPDVEVTGAHLLVHALVGADLLGPPGFRDLDRDGTWSDDTHASIAAGSVGLYGIDDEDGSELIPRYGGGGFVSDEMKEKSIRTLARLEEDGAIVFWEDTPQGTPTRDQPLFVDPWDRPILYYKANGATRRMIWEADNPGIYRQEDNAIITGSDSTEVSHTGIDFGAGIQVDSLYHRIGKAEAPDFLDDISEDNETYDDTFARYIWDPSIKARNTPVRTREYLLISAGSDGVFGTTDDVTNWTRQQD